MQQAIYPMRSLAALLSIAAGAALISAPALADTGKLLLTGGVSTVDVAAAAKK